MREHQLLIALISQIPDTWGEPENIRMDREKVTLLVQIENTIATHELPNEFRELFQRVTLREIKEHAYNESEDSRGDC